MDKSNLINLLVKRLTCGDFHCVSQSIQSFEFKNVGKNARGKNVRGKMARGKNVSAKVVKIDWVCLKREFPRVQMTNTRSRKH